MKTWRIIYEGSSVIEANTKEEALEKLDVKIIMEDLLTDIEEDEGNYV